MEEKSHHKKVVVLAHFFREISGGEKSFVSVPDEAERKTYLAFVFN